MPQVPSPIIFEPRRFRTSAEYYIRGRLSYPDKLIERVISITGLSPRDSVLDLGCGPGFLAVAFAPHAQKVLGIDPEPAMLEVATAYAHEKGVEVTFRLGSSYDLNEQTGSFHLVTMGRSFHWMDRTATLEILDRIVTPDGALALFKDSHPQIPQNQWRDRFQSVLEPFFRKDPVWAGRRDESWRLHESLLLQSKFNRLERVSVIEQVETPVERLVDRALSMSPTSPERLGPEMETVVEKLRDVLNQEATNGVIVEVVESEALIARR